MKIRKADIILAAVLALAALLLWSFTMNRAPEGDYVTVSSEGEILYTLPLNEDTLITIGHGENGYNVLVIEDGYASVTEASCPDLKCVKMKRINRDGQCIICLPNKLIIEVHSDTSPEVDSVVN